MPAASAPSTCQSLCRIRHTVNVSHGGSGYGDFRTKILASPSNFATSSSAFPGAEVPGFLYRPRGRSGHPRHPSTGREGRRSRRVWGVERSRGTPRHSPRRAARRTRPHDSPIGPRPKSDGENGCTPHRFFLNPVTPRPRLVSRGKILPQRSHRQPRGASSPNEASHRLGVLG